MNPRADYSAISEALSLQKQATQTLSDDQEETEGKVEDHEKRIRRLENRSAWLAGALAALGLVITIVLALKR